MHSFLREFLVEDSNSDKLHHHGYHRIYPWFLKHLKNQKIQLLEIGIDQAESIKLWCEYFSEIDIYGLDCAEKNFNHPRVKLYRVDQSQEDQLQSFAKNINTNFDIIIDDGSHVPDHQILTFKHFWSLLKPGGIYIIEDIETSYWGNSSILGYRLSLIHI